MLFFDSIFITNLALGHHLVPLFSFFLTVLALGFVLSQINELQGLRAPFFFVFAVVFYLADHIFQNRVDLNVDCFIGMTIRTCIVLLFPTVNARGAKELILALAALHWLPILRDYLITNATENEISNVSDLICILNANIIYYIF
jgi:hypothetical protein